MAKRWSKEEDEFLLKNMNSMKSREIAESLGRTLKAVVSRCTRLGATRTEEGRIAAMQFDRNGPSNGNWKGGRTKNTYQNYRKPWKEKNREKVLAQTRLQRAVKAGKITRQPCEVCGSINVDAHHEDYTKPFDVQWLCRKHHVLANQRRKARENLAS